tara:strand:+ start:1302 stop:2630 length:1329 start_codon:yes stop_codon:yes gene_type:complete
MNSEQLINKHSLDLEKALIGRNAQIGVIGLGYVGLPLALCFADESYNTVGFDTDKIKINKLSSGQSYIKHISNEKIKKAINNNLFVTNDWSIINKTDVIIICVPTPLNKNNEPDLQFIRTTLKFIQPFFRAGQLLILESTTYPGTTEEELVILAENLGYKIGENFFIGYSPEREDPGNQNFSTKTIPKVVSGHTSSCLQLTKALYDTIVELTVPVSSTRTAEMTKILENVHRAVNIGLVNELKIIADKMDIDIYEVIDAASTKPFGFTPYYPGPGLGGHCIPIDPFYLSWKAKKSGVDAEFIELAGKVNSLMPNWIINKLEEALIKSNISLVGAKILILGLAYKKNVDDTRESPSLELIQILINKGSIVDYSDPLIEVFPKTRKYDLSMKSINLTKKTLTSYDAIILSTDHDKFDYDKIQKYSQLIVDTRGRFKFGEKIIKA